MSVLPCETLTERERACLRLVAPGFQEKSIAGQLAISHHTVKVHLRSARAKLRVSSSLAAAEILARHEEELRRYGTNTTGGMAELRPSSDEPSTPFATPTKVPETVVREERIATVAPTYIDPDTSKARGNVDGLSPLYRLALFAIAVLFLTLAIVAAPAIYVSFQKIANRISPPDP